MTPKRTRTGLKIKVLLWAIIWQYYLHNHYHQSLMDPLFNVLGFLWAHQVSLFWRHCACFIYFFFNIISTAVVVILVLLLPSNHKSEYISGNERVNEQTRETDNNVFQWQKQMVMEKKSNGYYEDRQISSTTIIIVIRGSSLPLKSLAWHRCSSLFYKDNTQVLGMGLLKNQLDPGQIMARIRKDRINFQGGSSIIIIVKTQRKICKIPNSNIQMFEKEPTKQKIYRSTIQVKYKS